MRHKLTSSDRKIIFLSSLGGALEFYDFIIYVYAADVIGQQYFPNIDPSYGLLSALLVFSLSYFIRPLGGLLFSHFGDTEGRKKTFFLTVLLMAFPTLGIAVLPTYAEIGVTATVLLVVFRLIQGLAVGGEIPGAIAFTTEHIHESRWGFVCACLYVGICMGMVVAQGTMLGLRHFLSPHDFNDWGWRIAFYAGSVLALLALLVRRALRETPAFLAVKKKMKKSHIPLKVLLRDYRKPLLIGIGVTAIGSVDTYLLYVYLPKYLALFNLYPHTETMEWIQLGSLVSQAMLLPFAGMLADRYGIKRVYSWATLSLAIIALPVFFLFEVKTLGSLILATALFGPSSATIIPLIPCILVKLFPTEIRYTGVAVSYNIAYSFFGGMTPIVTIGLVQWTHITWMPALFLIMIALGACWSASRR